MRHSAAIPSGCARVLLLLLAAGAAAGQARVEPRALGRLVNRFEPRPDDQPLACTVTPMKPTLDFSFRFHSGYLVQVPMRQYLGPGHKWLVATRITPQGGDRQPVYLAAGIFLPNVPPTKALGQLAGGYLLGEGRYRVDWMLFDDSLRVCRKSWNLEAARQRGERSAKVAAPPFSVQSFYERTAPADPATRDDHAPFRITILMHAAPLVPMRTRLRASDQFVLLASLSALLERLPTRSVRLVLFTLEQQRELYRHDDFTVDRLEDVAQTLAGLELGAVDVHVLENRRGHLDLLADLVNRELKSAAPSDAVLFFGPATRFIDRPPASALEKPEGGPHPQFLYFQYRPQFRRADTVPLDSIGLTVSGLKGHIYSIYTPGDFAKAIGDLERRLKPAPISSSANRLRPPK